MKHGAQKDFFSCQLFKGSTRDGYAARTRAVSFGVARRLWLGKTCASVLSMANTGITATCAHDWLLHWIELPGQQSPGYHGLQHGRVIGGASHATLHCQQAPKCNPLAPRNPATLINMSQHRQSRPPSPRTQRICAPGSSHFGADKLFPQPHLSSSVGSSSSFSPRDDSG